MKNLIIAMSAVLCFASCSKEKDNTPSTFDYAYSEEVIDGINYKCVQIGDQLWMAENLRTRIAGGRADGGLTYQEGLVTAISKDELRVRLLKSITDGVFTDPNDPNKEVACSNIIRRSVIPGFLTTGGLYFRTPWSHLSEDYREAPENAATLIYFDFVEAEYFRIEKELRTETVSKAANMNYANEYGYLYTYEAAKKIAPSGWSLPSDEDWKTLERTLGMKVTDIELLDVWRGTLGKVLKETPGQPNFNGKLAGAFVFGRYEIGDKYINKGTRGYWWSSTKVVEADTASLYAIRGIRIDNDQVLRGTSRAEAAYNVRLIKKNN